VSALLLSVVHLLNEDRPLHDVTLSVHHVLCLHRFVPPRSSRIRDFRFWNSLKFANFIEFLKLVKIRLAILKLWPHSPDCSGAVSRLIYMPQQINLDSGPNLTADSLHKIQFLNDDKEITEGSVRTL